MTRLSYDLLAEVQEWDPTDSHDERYLIVASGESTLQERRRAVTEALRATGWTFAADSPSIGGKDRRGSGPERHRRDPRGRHPSLPARPCVAWLFGDRAGW